MTETIAAPTTKQVHYVGVKHKGQGEVQFIANYEDHLTALKYVNRLNCTRGLATGDVYVLVTVGVAVVNGL